MSFDKNRILFNNNDKYRFNKKNNQKTELKCNAKNAFLILVNRFSMNKIKIKSVFNEYSGFLPRKFDSLLVNPFSLLPGICWY